MEPGRIRERLRTAAAVQRVAVAGDEGREQRPATIPARPAAVLLGLLPRPAGVHILLTERTAHLKDHAGQISLPGGRMEPEDLNPAATALREAEEEVGLAPERVDILGSLPAYDTATGFRIHPIIGWVDPPDRFTLCPHEVADLFEVPVTFVLDSSNHRRDWYEREGRRRHFWVLPFERRYIWGATAGILVNFARLVSDSQPC